MNLHNRFNDNIYLDSYPRSGNTWMRYLIANILRPDNVWHINNLNDIVPDIYQVGIDSYLEPRIIKTHEPYTDGYPKVIYMYRDGRDVAVSYYNLSKTAFGYTGTFEEFLTAMLKGENVVVYGSWQDHVTGWLKSDKKEDLFSVKYEVLCADTLGVLTQLCSFIGVEATEYTISNAIEKSVFNVLKEDVKKYSPHYAKGFRGGVKGGAGKWREVFTEEMNELFWSYAGDQMTRLGYSKL